MKCRTCEEVKPADAFSIRKDPRKGRISYSRRTICKKCDAHTKNERKRQRRAVERALSLKSESTPNFIAGVAVPMSDVERRRRLAAAEAM